jgi:hypothetical protein
MTESRNKRTAGNGEQGSAGQRQKDIKRWLQERVRLLPFNLGVRQDADMPVGTRVLVLKGEARNDLGQMAIISAVLGSQVEISYRGPTGKIKTRRKQRASLIMLDEDVELFVNAQGLPIMRVIRPPDVTKEDDECGVVSSDDEN